MLLYTRGLLKGHSYSPTLECHLCCMTSQAKYVLFLSHIFLSLCLAYFSQLYSGRHGNECFLRGGILVLLLQRIKWREGERHAFFSALPLKACFCFHSRPGERKKKKKSSRQNILELLKWCF